MKRNISKILSLLLAAVLILSLVAPAALAAESAGSIYLRTTEDLAELSRNCTLDSWSQGKTVYLEADIDLTGVDFSPIPTFGGTFEGQGHTISGLSITGSGNVRGLFRYIQPTGAVRDLHVSGSIAPSDRKNTLGGLAGENQGTITNCTFSGAVSGADSIGGIAGINEVQGQIINCSFSGSVTGEHYVGGIAGQNYGSVVQCENSGSINTTEVDAELNLDNWNQDQLNAAENVPVCTDIGGITGFSSGILQGCVNTGAVGYAHVGYNIGGIVGRQSGYLNGCTNSGTVLGRKDVGGIAGQLEPEVRLLYNKGQVGDLLDELDVLRALIDQTGDDVRGSSDEISERMQAISDRAGEAQEAMSNLMDSATDWTNENIDEINDLSARLSWLTDELTPILDDATDAMDLMEELAGQMNDVMDEAQEAGDLAPDAADRFEDAMGDLGSAAQHGRDAVEHLKTALAHLRNVLGKPDVETALSEIQRAVSELSTALSDIAGCFARMHQILQEAESELQGMPEWDVIQEKLAAFQTACGALPGCLREVGDALAQVVRTGADDPDALVRLQTAAGNLLAAGQASGEAGAELAKALADAGPGGEPDLTAAYERLQTASQQLAAAQAEVDGILKHLGDTEAGKDLQTALDELNNAIAAAEQAAAEVEDALAALAGTEAAQAAAEALRAELTAIYASLGDAKTAAQELGAAAAKLVLPSVDTEELEAARREVRAAGDSLASALRALERGVDSGEDAVRRLRELLEQAGDVMDELQNAGDTMEELASLTSNLSKDLYDVLHELSEMPTITIHPISSGLREQGDALGDIFSGLLDDGDALRESMSSSTDILLDDLDAINQQFGVITDLLRDILEGSDEEFEDRFEDVSDEAPETTDTGYLSDARNDGTVEGDINVAGIVGSMAIEYDFDPEDDLIQEGDRSLDFRYQTKAVVASCINTGEITGKQNYTGGIVGLMDLGRVGNCENYGAVSSSDGDYVGGIAGASWGSIRDSWSKCRLSGGDYVGGVAGLGATLVSCHTLVTIAEGSAYLGAVAGDADREGTVSGNTFTSESLGALDGISYAGQAEPVDFDALCSTEGVPELFSQLELTFVAEGVTVAVVPFQYGEGVESLPEIPAKKGYSASWPDLDYTHLTASQTLEAVYTPYTSALTDGGELPQILVDGSFSSRAEVSHTTEDVTWTDDRGRTHAGTSYTVTVEDPDLEQVSYTVHYRLPDSGKRYDLWVLGEDGWIRGEHEIDGQYLLLTSRQAEITFCVLERPVNLLAWGAAAGALLLLAAGICAAVRFRKRRH